MSPAELEALEIQAGEATPAKQEAPLTPLEKLGFILLMIREYDAAPELAASEAPSGIPRDVVLAAFKKLCDEAEAEATGIACDEMVAALLRSKKTSRQAPKLADLPEFLTVDQVCSYLRVSRNVVYDAVRTGQMPSVRFAGRQIRIPRSHFEPLAQGSEAVTAEGAKS
jgi:excisionase family DNA binding protein